MCEIMTESNTIEPTRLILKSLPKSIEEKELKKFLKDFDITDIKLMYKPNGNFRRFAFVGVRNPEIAKRIMCELNNTYLKCSKIEIEFAAPLGYRPQPHHLTTHSGYQPPRSQPHLKTNLGSHSPPQPPSLKSSKIDTDVLEIDVDDREIFEEFLQLHGVDPSLSRVKFVDYRAKMTDNNPIGLKNNNRTIDKQLICNTLGDQNNNRKIDNQLIDKTIDNNTIGLKNVNNKTIGDQINNEIIDKKFNTKTIKDKVNNKTIGDQIIDNTIDNNIIGLNNLNNKTIGDQINDNTTDNNKIGLNNANNKTIDKKSNTKTIKDKVNNKTKGDQINNNTIDNKTIGLNKLNNKTIDNRIKDNNTIDNYNTIDNNTIGLNNVNNKTIDKKSNNKTIEDKLNNKTIDYQINNNTIDNKTKGLNKLNNKTIVNRIKDNNTIDDLKPGDSLKEAENTLNIIDTCRIFIRNLPYDFFETDIENFFNKIAHVSQVYIVRDNKTSLSKGYAFVTFKTPADAIRALDLDGFSLGGRVIHIMPAEIKHNFFNGGDLNFGGSRNGGKILGGNIFGDCGEAGGISACGGGKNFGAKNFSGKSLAEKTENSELSWNSLFIGAKTVAGVAEKNFGIPKNKLLKDDEGKNSMSSAVKLAIVETDIIHQTKQFLINNGVCLEAFNNKNVEKSNEVLVVKNLPIPTTLSDIKDFIIEKCSHYENFNLPKIILPPSGVSALLVFNNSFNATRAFKSLYFSKFKYVPFLLEWAPKNVITVTNTDEMELLQAMNIVYVKNLNFITTEESLRAKFEKIGKITNVTIAKDANKKSLGFGFIEFSSDKEAREAIKKMQHCLLDNHALLLKISNPNKKKKIKQIREEKNDSNTEEAIIIVKNLPFEANEQEIRQLFRVYGRLKNVRLPKKLHEDKERHRGFCFVEFLSRQEAENAYEALRFSTHLYGRRLVLDWANRESNIDHMRKKAQCSTLEIQTKKRKRLNKLEDLD